MRHCTCTGNLSMVPHDTATGSCSWCKRWDTDNHYRTSMGGTKLKAKQPKRTISKKATEVLAPPCWYRSLEVLKISVCQSCTGNKDVPLTMCSRFSEPCFTGVYNPKEGRSCMKCEVPAEERNPPPEPSLLQLTSPSLSVNMVMPSNKRPHVYRGGILQIWLTNACDRSCFNCTQLSNLAGKPRFMTPDQFRVAVASLKDYFGVVAVFGGNPMISPHFEEICRDLRAAIPWEQRGLWSNHPKGKGRTAAITFNPRYSNLNTHCSQEAYDEFARDWPESKSYLKGLDSDSRHSPPFVAMKDVIADEAERWRLIQDCDINKNWSAMICVFRGQLRGFFCEIAASQAMLHQDEPDYHDTGLPITPGWWKQGQEAFAGQIKKHCHECGIPLRGHGELANNPDGKEQVSQTHAANYKPKRPGRIVEVVDNLIQLGSPLVRITDYIQNGAIA